MELITNVTEYEQLAKQKLPKMVYDYYASGAEDQWTLKENRDAFSRILFRPRILIDVSRINMATNVLGFNISMPIMIAPSAMQKMAHPEGELATARAAAAAGTIMTLSSLSTSSVEEVNSVGPGIRFFQLYVYKDRNIVRQLVKRAEMAGFKAIALTVDTPRLGRREADIKNRFTLPPHLVLKNFEALDLGKMDKTNDSGLASYVAGQIDRSLSWKDVKWLQTITSLPILVKGIMTAEDTKLAVESGAAGIIVSNHGARQLDYVPATISCLEECQSNSGRQGGEGSPTGVPRRRRPPWHGRVQGPGAGSFRSIHWQAGAVLPRRGRRGRREEGAADAPRRAGAHHGAERLHVAGRDHPQPRRHRERQDPPLPALSSAVAGHLLIELCSVYKRFICQ